MKNRVLKIGIALGLFILLSGISITAVDITINKTNHKIIDNTLLEQIDMLIFLSPQYKDDTQIKDAINNYMSSVKDDIDWNIKIISINKQNNYFEDIDKTIEKYYNLYHIKACLMVGEDINTALSSDIDYTEKPSLVPWFTIGGNDAYDISENGIINKPYKMDICVSLIYPTSSLDYETKKSQIIFSFKKFSENRNIINDEISVFEASELNSNSKLNYQKIKNYGNLEYIEDPTDEEIRDSLDNIYLMYFVHGHSNPAGTKLNKDNGWFSADNIDTLKTSFFAADGCYVNGWWSNKIDNNKLDSSIDTIWYGSKILTSKYVKVMALGLLTQNGYSYSINFIDNALPDLSTGKTLAESLIGDSYVGDNVMIFGDPTFHF